MSARADEFARRREALQLQCALQREQFALSAAELSSGLHFMDRGLSVVRGTRVVPMIVAAVSALGLVSRSGPLLRLISRVWLIVNTVRQLKRTLR